MIEFIRSKHDPLYPLIPPHITLVFPFESDISSYTIETHVRQIAASFQPFSILLKGVTGTPDLYLFLNVKRGNDEIIAIHDSLYTGLLSRFWNCQFTYLPHLTVGKLDKEEAFHEALTETQVLAENFETMVTEIVVEVISTTGESVVETRVPLGFPYYS